VRPRDGLRKLMICVYAKVGKAAVVLLPDVNDGVTQLVAQDERPVRKRGCYNPGETSDMLYLYV